jgi:hypothetical protein
MNAYNGKRWSPCQSAEMLVRGKRKHDGNCPKQGVLWRDGAPCPRKKRKRIMWPTIVERNRIYYFFVQLFWALIRYLAYFSLIHHAMLQSNISRFVAMLMNLRVDYPLLPTSNLKIHFTLVHYILSNQPTNQDNGGMI